jgi:hypothetical protein
MYFAGLEGNSSPLTTEIVMYVLGRVMTASQIRKNLGNQTDGTDGGRFDYYREITGSPRGITGSYHQYASRTPIGYPNQSRLYKLVFQAWYPQGALLVAARLWYIHRRTGCGKYAIRCSLATRFIMLVSRASAYVSLVTLSMPAAASFLSR